MARSYEALKLEILRDLDIKIGELHERVNLANNALSKEVKERELLKQSYENFVKRLDSKIENFETVAQSMLSVGKSNKERINSMSTSIGEIAGHAAQALNKSNSTEDKFNKLWMRIFFSILGSTVLSQAILFAAFFAFSKFVIK